MGKFTGKRKLVTKKKKKSKKSKNAKDDWYTNDGVAGIYGIKKTRGKKEEDSDDYFEKDDGKYQVDSEQSESDSEEETPDLYGQLLSGLREASNDADTKAALRRIQLEQEGIEEETEAEEFHDHDAYKFENDVQIDEKNESENSFVQDESEPENSTMENEEESEPEYSTVENEDESESEGVSKKHDEFVFKKRFIEAYTLTEDECEELTADDSAPVPLKSKLVIGGGKMTVAVYGQVTAMPIPGTFHAADVNIDAFATLNSSFEIKERLGKRWLAYAHRRHKLNCRRIGEELVPDRNSIGLTSLQTSLAAPVFNYTDLIFNGRSLHNASELRELYVLHALNHVTKSRDLVSNHNVAIKERAQVRRQQKEAAIVEKTAFPEIDEAAQNEFDETIRDRGLTRPSVLIVVPNRAAALRVVRLLFELLPENANISNKTRFYDEYTEQNSEELDAISASIRREREKASESYDELYFATGTHPGIEDDMSIRKGSSARPADWLATFAGNNDECFKLGIGFNGRKSVKLYSSFYQSDLIIASPLGLRLSTGQGVGEGVDNDEEMSADEDDEGLEELGIDVKTEVRNKEIRKDGVDVDFLSSIEVCVVDQADVIEMQNWQHLVDVMEVMNSKPANLREDMDFSRVRQSFLLDGMPRRLRQTIVFTSTPNPYVNALFVPKSVSKMNLAGALTCRPSSFEGSIYDTVASNITHKFVAVNDKRIEYFENNVISTLKSDVAAHTLVIVPSYFDYIQVRNLFRRVAENMGETEDRLRGKGFQTVSKPKVKGRNGKKFKAPKYNIDESARSCLYVCCSEYTEPPQVIRCRGDFFHGRAKVFLTTERFYFYNRFKLRGIHRIVSYAPMANAQFYTELNDLIESEDSKVTNLTLFSERDSMTLERIVGTSNTRKMLASDKSVFTFETS